MTEYIDRRKLIENLAPILYEKGVVINNTVSRIIYGIQCEDTADVIERKKIDKAIEEIEQLINHSKLPTVNIYNRYSEGLKDCLEIIKRNIGE